MEDVLNVKCVSVNKSMQYVPMSCQGAKCPALCETTTYNTMTDISAKCEETKTTDVNGKTSLSTILPEISSKASTTSSLGKDTSVSVNMTKVTEHGTITTAIDMKTSLSTTQRTNAVTLKVSSTESTKISVTKETESRTITININKSSTQREQTINFVGSTTATPGTKPSVPVTMIQVTVLVPSD
ncbi:mucin-3A-like [Mytilus californianus]|uniref:mucin-3A-like n=1 Tax=Mytilus californianus TaxID=6549 RepID=UPI002246BCBC|nr:mucin-3A-like [Mytilus californianus]